MSDTKLKTNSFVVENLTNNAVICSVNLFANNISGVNFHGVDAQEVVFNNVTTGLTAVTVQGALDQLKHASNITYDDSITLYGFNNVQDALQDALTASRSTRVILQDTTITDTTITDTTYTLQLSDIGTVLVGDTTSELDVIIPADSTIDFPLGSIIYLRRDTDGAMEIRGADGVNVEGHGYLNKDQEIYVRKRGSNYWTTVPLLWSPIIAVGGAKNTYTYDGYSYTSHVFELSDSGKSFNIIESGINNGGIQYLIVGGGGGGGAGSGVTRPLSSRVRTAGGGGGGGRVVVGDLPAVAPGKYPVKVGAGGAPAASRTQSGRNGGVSEFQNIIATGGGGGGSGSNTSFARYGRIGGSRGGGSDGVEFFSDRYPTNINASPSFFEEDYPVPGLGQPGGIRGGGGGGALEAGKDGPVGNGGAGYGTSMFGNGFKFVAGGGGAGQGVPGVGGGSNNYGGGGQGAVDVSGTTKGGNGVVAIRYLNERVPALTAGFFEYLTTMPIFSTDSTMQTGTTVINGKNHRWIKMRSAGSHRITLGGGDSIRPVPFTLNIPMSCILVGAGGNGGEVPGIAGNRFFEGGGGAGGVLMGAFTFTLSPESNNFISVTVGDASPSEGCVGEPTSLTFDPVNNVTGSTFKVLGGSGGRRGDDDCVDNEGANGGGGATGRFTWFWRGSRYNYVQSSPTDITPTPRASIWYEVPILGTYLSAWGGFDGGSGIQKYPGGAGGGGGGATSAGGQGLTEFQTTGLYINKTVVYASRGGRGVNISPYLGSQGLQIVGGNPQDGFVAGGGGGDSRVFPSNVSFVTRDANNNRLIKVPLESADSGGGGYGFGRQSLRDGDPNKGGGGGGDGGKGGTGTAIIWFAIQ